LARHLAHFHIDWRYDPVPIDYHFDQAPGIVVGACGHGLAVIRSLHKGLVPVIALETNLDLPGVHTKLAQIEQVKDINGRGLIEALLALRPRVHCPGKPVLFLTNDNMVRTLATHWDALKPHYLLSWGHCREKIATLLEKNHLEAHCQQQGSAYPPSWLLHSASDIEAAIAATGASAIIKPTRPLAGFKTEFPRQRRDFDELIQRFEADLPFLVQKFIPGDDKDIYFCALYLSRGEIIARFDGHKLRSRPLGHTTIAESCIRDDVYQETLRFFAGQQLSGPVSLELKRDADGRLWVIEPTVGRTDFWLGLCTANRINLPLIEYRNQLSLPQQEQTQGTDYVWFNEERDPFARLWLALNPDLRLGKRRPSYLFLHRDDLLPALLSQKKTLSYLAARVLRGLPKLIKRASVSGNNSSAPSERESGEKYQLEVYRHPRDFPADVLDLFVRAEKSNIESGANWYANFVDTAIHEPNQVRFYVLRRDHLPIAALPLQLIIKPFRSELQSLTSFYSSFYTPLLHPAAMQVDLSALLQRIKSHHPGLSCIRTAPMERQAPATYLFLMALRDNGFISFEYFFFRNWFLKVRQNWAGYWRSRESRIRNTVKRSEKKLLALGGTLDIVSGGPELERALADYQLVYQSSWKRPEPFVHFVPGLVRVCAEQGWLRLGVARLQGRPIAAQIWIVNEGRASIFKLAYHEEFKAFSAGSQLTAHLLQHVIEVDRVSVVDYLIGDDGYKKHWMSDCGERIGIVAYKGNSFPGMVGAAKEFLLHLSKPLRAKLHRGRHHTGRFA